MRRLLSTLLIFPAVGALAADLPSVKQAPAFLTPASVFTWSGFYGGVEGGADFLQTKGSGFSSSQTAGPVGGLVGYYYQINRLVLGLEGDGGAVLAARKTVFDTSTLNAFANVATGANSYADICGRLGYAFADRALVYTTGGAAFGDVVTHYFSNLLGGAPVSIISNRTGWTAGAGVDYAFTDHWIGRVEYRYSDLGRAAAAAVPDHVSLTTKALMVGLIFKFGGPAVVARD